MGQSEVYEYLKKNKGKWFTCRDICEKKGWRSPSVTMSLKK